MVYKLSNTTYTKIEKRKSARRPRRAGAASPVPRRLDRTLVATTPTPESVMPSVARVIVHRSRIPPLHARPKPIALSRVFLLCAPLLAPALTL